MPTPVPPAPPAAAASRSADLLRRAAVVGAFCVGVAALIAAIDPQADFRRTLVYSAAIGSCSWLLVEGALRAAAAWQARRGAAVLAPGWPGLGWALAIVPLGTLPGWLAGTAIGDALTGTRSPLPLLDPSGRYAGVLVASLLTAAGITYVLYTRGRLAATRAQAAAAERTAAQAQLALLQSQLEPHMLFNTLANLRVLIGSDPPRAQAMLDRLIDFLRATLAASRSGEHALADEFDRVADYLSLIEVRMGPRLRVRLELPAALRELPVPALLLQPLVENSVRHGLEPQREGGRIEVRAALEGAALVLSVRDTGRGLDAGPPAPGGGPHFGLQQVRERLQVLYGDAASFGLQPAADAEGGTLARIVLPRPPSRAPAPAAAR